jgi:hypothetical protein
MTRAVPPSVEKAVEEFGIARYFLGVDKHDEECLQRCRNALTTLLAAIADAIETAASKGLLERLLEEQENEP